LVDAKRLQEITMTSSIRIDPDKSLLFITDPQIGDVPEFVPGVPMLSTSSCIQVAYLMWQDGETDVTLGPAGDVDPGGPPAFDSQLDTPNRSVIVCNIYREIALSEPVRNTRTRVRIWLNRLRWPDRVIVGLD
jgi:hypothetical protein